MARNGHRKPLRTPNPAGDRVRTETRIIARTQSPWARCHYMILTGHGAKDMPKRYLAERLPGATDVGIRMFCRRRLD